MTDETENRLDRLGHDAIQELHSLAEEMNAIQALEAQGADAALLQKRREAVTRRVRDMEPQIAELEKTLGHRQRKRA